MTTENTDSPQVITLPPLIFLGAIAAGAVLDWMWHMPVLTAELEYLRVPVGLVIIASGFIGMMTAASTFKKAGTNVNVWQPSIKVVTTGLFRYSRNPMYVGMALITVGAAVGLNSVWILVMLIPALLLIQWGVITREEAYLERKFGPEYTRYKEKVRRWF